MQYIYNIKGLSDLFQYRQSFEILLVECLQAWCDRELKIKWNRMKPSQIIRSFSIYPSKYQFLVIWNSVFTPISLEVCFSYVPHISFSMYKVKHFLQLYLYPWPNYPFQTTKIGTLQNISFLTSFIVMYIINVTFFNQSSLSPDDY